MKAGGAVVECPICHTLMPESARFCPGCGTPRTHVREELERRAAETGRPFEDLLAEARAADQQTRQIPGTAWSAPVPPAGPPAQPEKRSRLWLILGIIGGIFLLLCVCCAIVVAIAWDRFDVTVGESEAGRVAREELERGANGDFEGRWNLLHPDHRAVVPLEDFAACGERPDVGGIDILAEFTIETDIDFIGPADVRFVVYTLSGSTTGENTVVPMVEENGEWYWIMEGEDISAYQFGQCP